MIFYQEILSLLKCGRKIHQGKPDENTGFISLQK